MLHIRQNHPPPSISQGAANKVWPENVPNSPTNESSSTLTPPPASPPKPDPPSRISTPLSPLSPPPPSPQPPSPPVKYSPKPPPATSPPPPNQKVVTILDLNAELLRICLDLQARNLLHSHADAALISRKLQSNLAWLLAHAQAESSKADFAPLPEMDPPPETFSTQRVVHLYSQLPLVFAKDIARQQLRARGIAAPSPPSMLPQGSLKRGPDSALPDPIAKRRDTGEGKLSMSPAPTEQHQQTNAPGSMPPPQFLPNPTISQADGSMTQNNISEQQRRVLQMRQAQIAQQQYANIQQRNAQASQQLAASGRQMSPPAAPQTNPSGLSRQPSQSQSQPQPQHQQFTSPTTPQMQNAAAIAAAFGPAGLNNYKILQTPGHPMIQYMVNNVPGFSSLPLQQQLQKMQIVQINIAKQQQHQQQQQMNQGQSNMANPAAQLQQQQQQQMVNGAQPSLNVSGMMQNSAMAPNMQNQNAASMQALQQQALAQSQQTGQLTDSARLANAYQANNANAMAAAMANRLSQQQQQQQLGQLPQQSLSSSAMQQQMAMNGGSAAMHAQRQLLLLQQQQMRGAQGLGGVAGLGGAEAQAQALHQQRMAALSNRMIPDGGVGNMTMTDATGSTAQTPTITNQMTPQMPNASVQGVYPSLRSNPNVVPGIARSTRSPSIPASDGGGGMRTRPGGMSAGNVGIPGAMGGVGGGQVANSDDYNRMVMMMQAQRQRGQQQQQQPGQPQMSPIATMQYPGAGSPNPSSNGMNVSRAATATPNPHGGGVMTPSSAGPPPLLPTAPTNMVGTPNPNTPVSASWPGSRHSPIGPAGGGGQQSQPQYMSHHASSPTASVHQSEHAPTPRLSATPAPMSGPLSGVGSPPSAGGMAMQGNSESGGYDMFDVPWQ